MDENYHDHDCFWRKFWKHFLTWLMALLGAFLAFYVVSDWHFKKMYDPVYRMKKMDKMMEREGRYIEKSMKKGLDSQLRMEEKAEKIMHLEKGLNDYKVVVDLKAFDNNENNVETTVNGDTLTVSAAGINPKKDRLVKLSQSYTFGDEAELSELTKRRVGDEYVITIPVKK